MSFDEPFDYEFSFNLSTNWVIPCFPQQQGMQMTSYENEDVEFEALLDINQFLQEQLTMRIKANNLQGQMKERIKVEIVNLQDQERNETVSHVFTFSPTASELSFEFCHPASFYTAETGFLSTSGDLTFELSFETVDSVDSECVVSVAPRVIGPYQWSGWGYGTDDSKEKTGYVGLKNQGATCYMNSMLQSLFHIPAFRRMVYTIHAAENIDDDKNIPLNLQRLFSNLQLSDKAVSTTDLTKSFGWGDRDTFEQHDVHEFCRVLLDKIESKLKGSELENAIGNLFKGKLRSFIRCKNVKCESVRDEEFYDLQMVVKDCDTLKDSFDKYTEKEELVEDNQYMTDEFGKQDAVMGSEFVEMPKVLHIHLRRFDFDYETERQVKINSVFEFPTSIDLKEYMAPDCRTKPAQYVLHGVLVHSGCVYAGHYYAFLRTSSGEQWYQFNDTSVTKSTKEKAVDDNFGGDNRSYSGYLLVYVRRDAVEEVFAPIPDETLPRHLKEWNERYKKEQEEKEKQKQQLSVHVLSDKCMIANCKQAKFGFENSKEETILHLDKETTITEMLVKLGGTSVNVWKCSGTGIPQVIVQDSETTINTYSYYVNLYVRAKDDLLNEVSPQATTIWVKFFFPLSSEPLQYIAPFTVDSRHAKISSLFSRVNKVIGFPEETELLAYEEKPHVPRLLNPDKEFSDEDISDGAILILQQRPGTALLQPPEKYAGESPVVGASAEEAESPSLKDGFEVRRALKVPPVEEQTIIDYLAVKSEQLEVLIFDFNDYKKPLFWLRFPELATFRELKAYIAREAGIEFDPDHDAMELFKKDFDDESVPAYAPENLDFSQPSWIFTRYLAEGEYYKLWINVIHGKTEAEIKETLLMTLHIASDGNIVDINTRFRIAKLATIGRIQEELINQGILDGSQRWRFAEEFRSKIYQVYTESDIISSCSYPLAVARVTEEQERLVTLDGDWLLYGCDAYHDREYDRYEAYGMPFFVAAFRDETVGDVKERIKRDRKISDEDYSTLKFWIGDRFTAEKELSDDQLPMKDAVCSAGYVGIFVIHTRIATEKKKETYYYQRKEKAIKINN